MKKNLFLLLAFIAVGFTAAAQKANMIFFSQNEEKFFLVVNGIQQNAEPLSNVKITEMAAPMQYRVRIKFADNKLGILDDKVSVMPDVEKTWSIQAPKKKVANGPAFVIRVAGEVPVSSLPPQPGLPAPQVIVYHTEPLPAVTADGVSFNMNVNEQGGNVSLNVGGTGTTTTTTTNTSSTVTQYGEEGNTGTVVVTGNGCPAPLNQFEFNKQLARVTSQTTASGKKIVAQKIAQTTCLTAAQVYELCDALTYSNDKLDLAKFCYSRCFDPQHYEEVYKAFPISSMVKELDDYINRTGGQHPHPRPHTTTVPAVVFVPGYNGPYGCAAPMNSSSFAAAKNTIADADFENTKLSTAKTIVGANCVTADQVMEICKLFDFENSKLEFAKFAYSKTYDKGNYFKVNTVFDFDASKEALNKYVQNGGR